MEERNLCINCLQEKGAAQHICPYCGFDEDSIEMLQHTLQPRSKLKGRYVIGRVLGEGGFGITYLALDLSLGRPVAVKEYYLAEGMSRDSREATEVTIQSSDRQTLKICKVSRRQFEQEARILAQLSDLPHIVHVHDYFTQNSTAYIVMDYLKGPTLREYVRQKGKLSFKEALEILSPVMEDLEKVHLRDILHRDISPDNLKVLQEGNPAGQAVLFDFGGSTCLPVKEKDVVPGKAGFTPIEQSMGAKLGPWTDVYAMAATFYFAVTGSAPLRAGERLLGTVHLPLPRQLNRRITDRQEKVILTGMAVRPEQRYHSMRQFLAALQGRGLRGCQLAAILAAAALLLLCGGWWKYEPEIRRFLSRQINAQAHADQKQRVSGDQTHISEMQENDGNESTELPIRDGDTQSETVGLNANPQTETLAPHYPKDLTMGVFEQDNNPVDGRESVDWQVLTVEKETRRALVVSRNLLFIKEFNNQANVPADRLTWENSTLQGVLQDFYEGSFSDAEKQMICKGETGAVFLLSAEEIETYMKTKEEKVARLTAYAPINWGMPGRGRCGAI